MPIKPFLPFPLLLAALAACTPSLNWREVRPEGTTDLVLMFPCKPEQETRPLVAPDAPATARMGLARCETAGLGFSLSWADVPDPSQLGPSLQQMRAAVVDGLKLPAGEPQALQLAGMMPSPHALTQALGAPDGKGPQARLAVFARGLRVYQLMMLGPRADAAAWEGFLGSLRLGETALPG
ncbi:hypothetical protein [Pelomonas sp. SE-A7]|uniref:hypothetical protein n=1 Tax=Pelomonas sp. SE-A7 TaxID=3054953 RepID=UPI00259C6FB3|nr:hypothetical protein [Pelomonas sp. SE-A7]MDM4767971.1 hypothetical protein [Pelomonas sp. SE-A7]